MTVETVRRGDERLGQGGVPADRVAAQAFSSFNTATIVTVARDTQVGRADRDRRHRARRGRDGLRAPADPGRANSPRPSSSSTSAAAEPTPTTSRFVVGDAARLTVVSIADWADDAVHVSAHHAALGKDAVLRHVAVTLGGDVVRLTARPCGSRAPAATPSCSACTSPTTASTSSRGCWSTTRSPNCKFDVLYKGALQGDPDSNKPDAHTVWIGDVLIRAEATGTDTFEANRNLVLTDGARADSVPNLEIETGEIVGAGHASATGRFDDEQLFYLRARGIPEDQARRLVVRGFFGEIIAKIAVPAVRERLTDAIEHELAITESRTTTS